MRRWIVGAGFVNVGMFLILRLAQSWTNSHLFAHAAIRGPVFVSIVLWAGVALAFRVYVKQGGNWRWHAGAAALTTATFWTFRLLTLECQGCASGG
jgi:hypothetical protein